MTSFDLAAFQEQFKAQRSTLPPVEKWDPDFCGNIDMEIKHDASWQYMGSPVSRSALVKLFASVLKREGENYYLVTPVEKVGIKVEDVPFIITQWQHEDSKLVLTSNVGDVIKVGVDNPVELLADKTTGSILPYVLIRRNLWARLHQNVFYQLAELGEEQDLDGVTHLTLKSGKYSFSLGTF
ncbi:DUF1285 domain-containing protein [Paraglaciecola sp. 2405UD69-4]|uniref:DUF1285 domain-containing protein n=1 Tax=Paraglaciecola sp. 2405UD69-4 TaxID=3391836 RepID=UPI0039C91FF4